MSSCGSLSSRLPPLPLKPIAMSNCFAALAAEDTESEEVLASIAMLRAEEATILSDVEGMAAMVVQTQFAKDLLKSQCEWCCWRLAAIRAELAETSSGNLC